MKKKLFYLKLIHTIIWFIYVLIIGYILYASISNKIDMYLYLAIASVVFEGIVLMIFQWRCPLTVWGYKYTEDREVGFDIFLPKWLAKNNKSIFTPIFLIGVLITIYRIM